MYYYLTYIAFLSIIWNVLTVSYLLITWPCEGIIPGGYMIVVTVGNIGQVCQPFLMAWIRLNDPLIKKLIKRKLKSYTPRSDLSLSLSCSSLNNDNIDHIVQRDKEIQLFTYFVGMSIAINQYLSKEI